jgi:hypothetical protein
MSDTPRTDAEAFWPHDSQYKVCDAVFARQLEGELNAANAIIKQQQLLDEENLRLQEHIKRLEEAGDALANNHNPFTFIDWLKAKEAKL